ncbi:MAG TPA: PepSY-associated TM helix domain-containing protein [Bryobacteraceae bacterium]|nr:PepSY-associated TM helix domain-containing protein [Bryobacteraceae bacterium]
MYSFLRNIHLTLALLALPFLLLYGFSSIQMTHSSWIRWKPVITDRHVTLAANTDARTIARELMDHHGMRGELQQIFTTPASQKLSIVRPGTIYEIEYTPSTGEASIKTFTAGFIGMLNRLHHAAGFWHNYWPTNLWSGFVAWASVAIILLGLTGVCLWFTRRQDRVAGPILLAANLAISLTLLFLIRFP